MDYVSIGRAVRFGSITIKAVLGRIGTVSINEDAGPNTLTVNGGVGINAGPGSGTTGTIENVVILRAKSTQAVTIRAAAKSLIGNVSINSPLTCLPAILAQAVAISTDEVTASTASIGSVAIYATTLGAGLNVSSNGRIGAVTVGGESSAGCSPLTITGNVVLKTTSADLAQAVISQIGTITGDLTIQTNTGNMPSVAITARSSFSPVTVGGTVLITTSTGTVGRITSAVIGPVVSVGKNFTVVARGGAIGSVEIVGPGAGTRFDAGVSILSSGPSVAVTMGNVRCVAWALGLGRVYVCVCVCARARYIDETMRCVSLFSLTFAARWGRRWSWRR